MTLPQESLFLFKVGGGGGGGRKETETLAEAVIDWEKFDIGSRDLECSELLDLKVQVMTFV